MAIVQKLRAKADREFMQDFHDQVVGYVAKLEMVVEHITSEPEPKRVQMPRRLRRRGR